MPPRYTFVTYRTDSSLQINLNTNAGSGPMSSCRSRSFGIAIIVAFDCSPDCLCLGKHLLPLHGWSHASELSGTASPESVVEIGADMLGLKTQEVIFSRVCASGNYMSYTNEVYLPHESPWDQPALSTDITSIRRSHTAGRTSTAKKCAVSSFGCRPDSL